METGAETPLLNMANTQTETRTRATLQYPSRYNVIIFNDDYTPMDFVIRLLVEVFNHNIDAATAITTEIHSSGRGIAGTYSKEVAEQKSSECNLLSRHAGYPLKTLTETV